MKKFVSLMLALVMVLSLAACGQPAAQSSGTPSLSLIHISEPTRR